MQGYFVNHLIKKALILNKDKGLINLMKSFKKIVVFETDYCYYCYLIE